MIPSPNKLPTLHALLVGINDYHPDSNVNSLGGTHSDIDTLSDFLSENYSKYFSVQQIKILKDQEATYGEVIKHFYQNLCLSAQPGDVALFHFSGHGSFNKTAKELQPLSDSKLQDETLVCYDSRLEGNHDLSDKELAVLIEQFQSGVDVIVLADSCFSGSITRGEEEKFGKEDKLDIGVKERYKDQSKTPRNLDSYFKDIKIAVLKDYYTSKYKNGALSIPSSRQIVMMACNREQKAYESSFGGYFTQTLIDILKKTEYPVSYIELFQRIRTYILNAKQMKQTPVFDVFGDFNCKQHFLLQSIDPGKGEYHVEYRNGEWTMLYGAIHGLEIPEPTSNLSKNRLRVLLYSNSQSDDKPISAYATAVNMGSTILQIDDAEQIDTRSTYKAEIVSLSHSTTQFFINTQTEITTNFMLYTRQKSPLICFTNNPNEAKYEILFDQDGADTRIRLNQVSPEKFIQGIRIPKSSNLKAAYNSMCDVLQIVEKWERLLPVTNKSNILRDKVSWYLEIQDEKKVWITKEEKEITIGFDGLRKIPFNIVVSNHSGQELFLTLLWFKTDDFKILNLLQQDTVIATNTARMVIFGTELNPAHLLSTNDQPEDITMLKLILGNKKTDNFLFQQPNPIRIGEYMQPDRFIEAVDTDRGSLFIEEWFTENMIIKVIKKTDNI